MRATLFVVLLLAGCDRAAPTDAPDTAGARLEAAATNAGLVPDANASAEGSWGRDTDRMCIVAGRDGLRAGALVDYGEGQGCSASGTAERSGDGLKLRFGDCRIDARYDGDRVTLPAEVPEACESLCTGRATLAAMTVDRLSQSRSEAATLRSTDGRLLCGD